MTPSIQSVDYSLVLGTGEKMHFAELDEGSVEALHDAAAKESISGILDKCTRVCHSTLEEAKLGHTKGLEKALKTPPFGAMMKIDKPICSQIGCCVMANLSKCTTRNCEQKGGLFPECWEYSTTNPVGAELARCIVHAWRQGFQVLIVTAG